jgi:hypothetical protein
MRGEAHPEWLGVVWSVGRSLWDQVTPPLRYVSFGLVEGTIVARFAYEHPPSDADRELVSEAETSVIADFHHLFETDFQAVHRPRATARIFEDGTHWWAYLRREAAEG